MAMHVIVRASVVTLSSVGPMGTLGGFLGSPVMFLAVIAACVMFLRMFFSLFRRYRSYKILVDTPEIQIRSAALGLVKIRGKAECDQLVPAPFSQKPCCFYKTTIETGLSGRDEDGEWQELRTDLGGSRFLLADETGRIMIDTPEVSVRDINVGQTFKKVVDGSFPPLIEYSEKLDAERERRLHHPWECRLFEWSVLPGEEYMVIGYRIENPDPQAAPAGRYLVCAGEGMLFAIFSEAEEAELLRSYAKTSVTVGTIVAAGSMFLGCLALIIAMLVAVINKLEGASR